MVIKVGVTCSGDMMPRPREDPRSSVVFWPSCLSTSRIRASRCLQGLESHPVCLVKFPRTPAVMGLLCSFVCPVWTRSAAILSRQNSFLPAYMHRFSSGGNLPCNYDGESRTIFLSGLRGRIWVLYIAFIFSTSEQLEVCFLFEAFF